MRSIPFPIATVGPVILITAYGSIAQAVEALKAGVLEYKVLRALQERKVRRVGGADEIAVDVRIIAATNQDLKKRIQEGEFREELFYRLDEITKKYIQDALAATGGSLQKAAPLLGISYRTIRYLIGKYDLNQVRKAERRNGNGDRNPT